MKSVRRTLNVKFALLVLAAVGVLGVAAHLVQGYQVRRNASVLLEHAERAKAAGETGKALDYLYRYIRLAPDEVEPLVDYGMLLAEQSKQSRSAKSLLRAYFTLEQVLRRDADRHEVRKEVVRLAMDPRLQRHPDAVEHLNILLETFANDGTLLNLRARSHYALTQYKQSRADFEAAIAATKTVEAYCGLADLLREHDSKVKLPAEKTLKEVHDKADAVIKVLLEEHKQSHQAHLWAAGHYRRFAAQIGLEKAEELAAERIEKAHALAPDELEVILAVADLEQGRKNVAKARTELERGITLHADKWQPYQALARLELRDEQIDAGLEALRRGLKAFPNQIDLQWNLAHVLSYRGESPEFTETIAKLEKQGFPTADLDYLRARVLVGGEHWRKAIHLLENAHPMLLGRADQHRDWLATNLVLETNLLLGRCYENLGDLDAAASAYLRAVSRAPTSVPARLGLARMEWALGKFDNAVREYQILMQSRQAPAAAWLECVQLLIDRNLRRNKTDWTEAKRILQAAETLKPVPVQVGLLRAEMLAAEKQFDKAQELLLKEHADVNVRPVEVWVGMANIEQRQNKHDSALSLLDDAAKKHGDRLELRLARCRYWARRGGPEAPRALDTISQDVDKLPIGDQRRLLAVLAASYHHLGETKRAEAMWERVAEKRENDYSSRLALFDLAIQQKEYDRAEELVEALRNIETADGTLWRYCKACVAIAAHVGDAKSDAKSDAKALADAGSLLNDVVKRRPTWGRVRMAQGRLAEAQGDVNRAISHYYQADALSEDIPGVFERLVALLSARGRYAEVTELFESRRRQGLTVSNLERLEAHALLNQRDSDPETALRIAEKTNIAESKNYSEHLWLAGVRARAGKLAESEASVRQALKLAPDVPDVWIALVGHYARAKQTAEQEKSKTALAKAKQGLAATLADAEKALHAETARAGLAHCFMLAGEFDRAKKLYDAAVAANPEDAAALDGLVRHAFLKGQRKEAIGYLDQMLLIKNLPAERAAQVKRTMAVIIGQGGGYQESIKALNILGVLDASDQPAVAQDSLADQRSKIVILARAQNVTQRRQAVTLLESLLRQQQITLEERQLLAQLYDTIGQWPKANEQYLFVLTEAARGIDRDPRNKELLTKRYADQLTVYCAALLRHDAASKVEPWLEKLEALEPKSLRSVALRARLLDKQDRGAEAVDDLLALEKNDERVAGSVAGVLEQIGQAAKAEELYKKHIAQAKRPEASLALAAFYGRQKRMDEALAICEAALKTCKIDQVSSVAVLVLYTGSPTSQHLHRVANWIQAGIEREPKTTSLLSDLAAVRRLQQDYAGVIALYRESLKTNNTDTLMLNNLAWLVALSERNGTAALESIERAIELDGPQANLLDTRAVAYLANNQPTAHRYFHLAQAHHQAGEMAAARDVFQRGVRLGLAEDKVDPLERDAYRRLRSELDVKAAGR
jgi:cellulose synthase operon protein C